MSIIHTRHQDTQAIEHGRKQLDSIRFPSSAARRTRQGRCTGLVDGGERSQTPGTRSHLIYDISLFMNVCPFMRATARIPQNFWPGRVQCTSSSFGWRAFGWRRSKRPACRPSGVRCSESSAAAIRSAPAPAAPPVTRAAMVLATIRAAALSVPAVPRAERAQRAMRRIAPSTQPSSPIRLPLRAEGVPRRHCPFG